MRLRLTLTALALSIVGGLAFIASPFWTAWSLREAIRTGDKAYLERKIEWDSVRTTLKASMARHASLVPEINATSEAFKPGLWQRVKMAFGQSMIDGFVERYVTPEGLPQLFEYRRTFNQKVRGEPDERETLGRLERFKRFWSRLQRAQFLSPTLVEIEMKDRRNPERNYVSVLELKGFEWKLTALGIVAANRVQPSAPLKLLEADTTIVPALR
jgi:hypothetical protein